MLTVILVGVTRNVDSEEIVQTSGSQAPLPSSGDETLDTCIYINGNEVKCGDQCIYPTADCQCGSDTFKPRLTDQFCCLPPGGTCIADPSDQGLVVCSEGRTLSMSNRCENTTRNMTCHNDYLIGLSRISEFNIPILGPESHFTCPDSCVSWEDMCRGVSWCSAELEVCDSDLRCQRQYLDERNLNGNDKINVTKKSISLSPGTAHYYCLSDAHINNQQYDSIHREDEQVLSVDRSALDINITSFTQCNYNSTKDDGKSSYSAPGVMCGSDCIQSSWWCNEAEAVKCYVSETEFIWSIDPQLCSNPVPWREVDCRVESEGRVDNYGLRCRGRNMGCAYPWYMQYDGYTSEILDGKCSDRSDEIFFEGWTCRQYLNSYVDLHQLSFCNSEYPEVNSSLICTDKWKWLSTAPDLWNYGPDPYYDPHNCQSSCEVPDLDCQACSNSSYVMCGQSGLCIPPELVCDGHPQCPGGEDEDLQNCHQAYIENHIVEPYASYQCKSPFYGEMDVYATPCNNRRECMDGSGKSLYISFSLNLKKEVLSKPMSRSFHTF